MMKTRIASNYPILMAVVLLFSACTSADEPIACEQKDCDLVIQARMANDLVMQIRLTNNSSEPLTFYNGQFLVPFLRLIVVDRYGDRVERFSWVGDPTFEEIVVKSSSSHDIDIDLERWYDGLGSRLKSECFDVLWALHIKPTNSEKEYFAGGAFQLSCK